MATIIDTFPRGERDRAHQRQAAIIADGSHPRATCQETEQAVLIWDEPPTPDEMQATHERYS